MMRYRRYRAFVVFAVIAVLAIYQFGSGSSQVDYLKQQLSFHGGKQDSSSDTSKSSHDHVAQDIIKGGTPPIVQPKGKPDPIKDVPAAAAESKLVPPPVEEPKKPKQHVPPDNRPKTGGKNTPDEFGDKAPVKTAPKIDEESSTPKKPAKKPAKEVDEDGEVETTTKSSKDKSDGRVRVMPNPISPDSFEKIHPNDYGEGRWENDQLPLDVEPIFWQRPKEHFPIEDEDVITLPAGTPKKMPKIQADFKEETAEENKDRLGKLAIIKKEFLHAWGGYKDNAWGHDEIKPVSGDYKNPFNGWGATLVDTLDLLWMMGLEEEFEAAVAQVGKINFKTSRRADIPIFETTIRYLGGLLGAYDVSGGKHRILLDKAAELAEILIGAFDTPNHMPELFYQWKPDFASQPHRASSRVVLAEIGSLALEFTRLAQLTKEPRYYDAVARITNALERWQMETRLPGMWPSHLDASGCEKKYLSGPSTSEVAASGNVEILGPDGTPLYKSGSKATGDTTPASKDSETKSKDGGMTSKDAVSHNRDEDELEGVEKFQPIKSGKGKDSKKLDGTLEADGDGVKKGRISGYDDIHKGDKTGKASKEDDSKPKLPGPKKQAKPEDEFVPLVVPEPIVFNVKHDNQKRQLEEFENEELVKASSHGPGQSAYDEHVIPSQISGHKHDADLELPLAPTRIDITKEECTPQGLNSVTKFGTDDFTLGSLADSTYEYLPKMHLLLNGLTDQYKDMYLKAIDAAKDHLLFRMMIPEENREILVSGQYSVTQNIATNDGKPVAMTRKLKTGGSHLTCFVGGMFAMGSKLFDRKDDLEIAKKLTDGCVYAYGMTATGIMPETFNAVACDDFKDCKWNETKWWEMLDPDLGEWRWKNYETGVKMYESQMAVRESLTAAKGDDEEEEVVKAPKKSIKETLEDADKEDGVYKNGVYEKKLKPKVFEDLDDDEDDEMNSVRKASKNTVIVGDESDDRSKVADLDVDLKKTRSNSGLTKRQLKVTESEMSDEARAASELVHDSDYWEKVAHAQDQYEAQQAEKQIEIAKGSFDYGAEWQEPTATMDYLPPIYSPVKPLKHEDFVKKMIEEDRLPPGVQSIGDRRYILRPEALESVFYMHRITGSPYWRRAGWKMISSILKHTKTQLAHSAIDDVTKATPKVTDSMESFWLAETLKYAWLLFEDEDKWSLDEWVFNTEAHPLRRTGLDETTKKKAKSDRTVAAK